MAKLMFLIDVDNTLLANDEVKQGYNSGISPELGPKLTERFWELYEQVRHETGIINIPLSLQRLREQTPLSELNQQTYLHVVSVFDNYPFSDDLYPYALETIQYLSTLGTTVIVSDGDQIFQSRKIVQSGLANAVGGRVLIFDHKQQHIPEIFQKYPADHYITIDDRPDILVDMKKYLGAQITTVFVHQGKYAEEEIPDFTPDLDVLHIGDLRNYTSEQFLKA